MFDLKKESKAGRGGSAPFKLSLGETAESTLGVVDSSDVIEDEETEKLARLLGISKKKKQKGGKGKKKRKNDFQHISKKGFPVEQQLSKKPKKQRLRKNPSAVVLTQT